MLEELTLSETEMHAIFTPARSSRVPATHPPLIFSLLAASLARLAICCSARYWLALFLLDRRRLCRWVGDGGGGPEHGHMSLTSVKDPFLQVLERIADLVRSQLSAAASSAVAGPCRAVVVVGGFAQQPFLQRYLTAAIQEEGGVPVVFPESPGAAVVEGSVIYGASRRVVLRCAVLRCAVLCCAVQCAAEDEAAGADTSSGCFERVVGLLGGGC